MHKPFLHQVAEHYYKQYGADIRHLTFVFPSKRAQLFFVRYLGQIAQEPIFAPLCTTIGQWLPSLKPELRVLDRPALLFELYTCYQDERGARAESFDEFLFWGNLILSDFDLIDRHMVEARDLYRNIEGLKEMTDDLSYLSDEALALIERFWRGFRNPRRMEAGEAMDYRQNFMDFWLSLYPIYRALGEDLEAKGYTWEGRLYRYIAHEAVDIVDRLTQESELNGRRYVFVGLFELTESELKLFRQMRQRQIADFVWDEEVRIVHDPSHPASRMLRSNIEALGQALPRKHYTELELASLLPREVEVVRCASAVTQVKALSGVLQRQGVDLDKNPERIDTAIILPSEQMLLPVVASIPSNYEYLNVTLGYPLSRTSVAVLINRWVRLILSAQEHAYPIERLTSLLTLQLLTEYYPGLRLINKSLQAQRSFMLSERWIRTTLLERLMSKAQDAGDVETVAEIEAVRPLLELLLPEPKTAYEALERLEQLLDDIGQKMAHQLALSKGQDEEDNEHTREQIERSLTFDLEFIYHHRSLVTRLKGLIESYAVTMSPESAMRLIDGMALNITIPFEGNPLRGLQIMGLLESRLLHFRSTVFVSAQEGMLSRSKSGNTLIPYTLRQAFGLPLRQWQDAADSYRFYQTIARTSHLTLLYGQEDALGTKGELSRYVAQMEMLYGVKVKRLTAQAQIGRTITKLTPIPKSLPHIVDKLARYSSHGEDALYISPSSLQMYMECPLRFYYQQVLGVREDDKHSPLMPANDFGTILHNSMEALYSHEPNKPCEITSGYIDQLLERGNTAIERTVCRELLRLYSSEGSESKVRELGGLQRYYVRLIERYIRRVMAYDRHHTPFRHLRSEATLYLQHPLSDGRIINIKGKIDRLDLCNVEGKYRLRLLDYKTGQDEPYRGSLVDLFEQNKSKASIQTLIYSELALSGKMKEGKLGIPEAQNYPIAPGILAIRKMSSPDQYNPYLKLENDLLLDYQEQARVQVLDLLTSKLDELFDLNHPFERTDNIKSCTYCPFTDICGR